jgi:hypothetical protein
MRRTAAVVGLAIGVMFMAGCSPHIGRSTGSAVGGSEASPVVATGTVASTGTAASDISARGPVKIVFLHHSTGGVIWAGRTWKVVQKVLGTSDVASWFTEYNRANHTDLRIEQLEFPTGNDYEWANYPYDYYNIWVKHAGSAPYRGEPTLEMLTAKYDVIIWKHCFPVGNILPDTGVANIDSSEKRLENYKLQYAALKEKMHSFPDTRFIVWTGAALLQSGTTPDEARRTREFFDWVKSQWDEPGDNIFVWDFYQLETEGGPYLKPEYAASRNDSHPNSDFAGTVAPLFAQRIVNVIMGKGDSTSLTGL